MTDRTEYQKAYMREWRAKRKAALPPPREKVLEDALNAIVAKLKGNEKPLAVEIRKLAEEGLG